MNEIYLGNIMGPPGPSVIVDTEVSDTSENAIQNKAIKKYVDEQLETKLNNIQIATSEDIQNVISGTTVEE
jgi:hypothetical protein